jgi:hypothetical protein
LRRSVPFETQAAIGVSKATGSRTEATPAANENVDSISMPRACTMRLMCASAIVMNLGTFAFRSLRCSQSITSAWSHA